MGDGHGRGARKRSFVTQGGRAAIDQGRAGVVMAAVKSQRVLACAGKVHIALDGAGPITPCIVLVHKQTAGAGAAGDDAACIGDCGVTKECQNLLGVPIQIQRGVVDGHEVVRLESIFDPSAQLERAAVKNQLTAHRIDAQAGKTRDQ